MSPRRQDGWQVRPAVWLHKNPRLRARRHKLLPHQLFPKADYSLWMDGCLQLLEDPRNLVEKYLRYHDICLFDHMQRNCIYQEAEACRRLRKDNAEVLRKLVLRYRAEGYPEHRGLAETTAVLRRHSEDVRKLNEEWWEELRNHSIRDQMSFDYVMWKLGMEYMTFEGTRTNSPHFKWTPHR